MSQKIVSLMKAPERDLTWLKQSVQAAVELELSTIPVYLSGYWSITNDATMQVTNILQSVVVEEMLHMGLMCNLLGALGEVPQIAAGYQKEIHYPGGLPGGVHPGLVVSLQGLTREVVQDTYMAIELPEDPLAITGGFPTIGGFYDAIAACIMALQPTLVTTNQVKTYFGSKPKNLLTVIATVEDALAAINVIKEQGEGTSAPQSDSPYVPVFHTGEDPVKGDYELAHYYKFAEVFNGASLINVDGEWVYMGTPVPFPDNVQVPPVPAGGYLVEASSPVGQALTAFNVNFTGLLNALQNAWATGSSDELQFAVNVMFTLKAAAQAIYSFPLPDHSGYYGPEFKYLPR